MYAKLTFFTDRPEAPWTAEYFALPGVGEDVPDKLLRVRRLSTKALAKTQTQLSVGEQNALGERIFQAIERVPDDLSAYSFGAHMAMAHFVLPPAERQRREAAIESLDEALLAPAKLEALDVWRSATRCMAVLVPDVALDAVYRSSVAHLFLYLRDQPDHGQHICRRTGWRDQEARFLDQPDLAKSLAAAYFTRRFGERQAFVDLLRSITPTELAKLLAAVNQSIDASGREVLLADRCEAHLGAMRAWQALPAESQTEDARAIVVALERERLTMRESARCLQIVAATLEARTKGTAFGSDADKKNREASELSRQSQVRQTRAMAPSRQRLSPTPRPKEPTAPVTQADLDPVHAWSIDRLLHWIDGPVAQPQRPLQLDRLCATEQEDWVAEQKRRKQDDAPDDGPLQEQEVQMVVTQGLQSTAQFLLDELNDLISLGTKLQADEALLRACQDCLPGLRALVKQVIAWEAGDTDQTVAELQRADRALEALRRGIQQRQGEEQTRQRFTAALFRGLRNEPLLLGKRHGGVIAEPLPLEEWAWAVNSFHQRWWNAGLRPDATAAPVPLASDQALALYVTGSSLSDYAFDISVHLWKRRANSDAPPTTGVGLAPMNQPDWFDTLIPCAVLHVQAKA
jgi:hypothetical protein